MAGTLVTIIPPSEFTFTSVGATASETIIARALSVVPYREGVLVARIHSKSNTAAGASQALSVVVRAVAPTSDDPTAEFAVTTSDVAVVTFNCNSSTSAPMMAVGAFTAPFSPFVRVLLRAVQGTQNDVFTATVSVDLVLRE